MYKKVYRLFLLLPFFFLTLLTHAQDTTAVRQVEMADKLRADGKIWVVIVVLVVILLGLILYVTRLDRKITRLEKDLHESGSGPK